MDAKELRGKSATEMSDELLKMRKEQFALRMQRATGQAPKRPTRYPPAVDERVWPKARAMNARAAVARLEWMDPSRK